MAVETKNIYAVTHWTGESSSLLRLALMNNKLKEINRLLTDETLVNISLQTTGVLAGYTAMHFASMEYNDVLMDSLSENHNADVNVAADDGTQPIHLACLFGNEKGVKILLEAGANVHADIKRDLFSKYKKDMVWCDDFGDKMTLLTFAVVYSQFLIAEILIAKKADLRVRDCRNKTLLMYAIGNDLWTAQMIIQELKDRKIINARDDDGFAAIHYLFYPKEYGNFRYIPRSVNQSERLDILESLIKCGADIYATVNNDPDTLLLNMAAYRSCSATLRYLLPHYDDITKSRALYYATLLLENLDTTLRLNPFEDEQEQWECLVERRNECTELVLKDLVYRSEFGLPVSGEEIKLMNGLIATDVNTKKFIRDYKEKFIQGILKDNVIYYGDKSIFCYDFILKSCEKRELRSIVQNQELMDAFKHYRISKDNDFDLRHLLRRRIERECQRVQVLDKLKGIQHLRKAIPLSYELIVEIFKYLDNYDLKNLIDAFLHV